MVVYAGPSATAIHTVYVSMPNRAEAAITLRRALWAEAPLPCRSAPYATRHLSSAGSESERLQGTDGFWWPGRGCPCRPLIEQCSARIKTLAHGTVLRRSATTMCARLGLSADQDTAVFELALIRSGSNPGTFTVS